MSVEFLEAPNIGVKHGFFGCSGGVSRGIYAGLNCALSSADDADPVLKNRALVAGKMGIAAANLLTLKQIHSTDVIEISEIPMPETHPKGDAMVSALPDIGLGIITADCVPVLFHDPVKNIVGAAHAGWQGAVFGVVERTIAKMVEIGARRENIHSCIGPCISQKAYEVGQEFFEIFLDHDTENTRFFVNGAAGKYQFDLGGFVITRLRAQGLASAEWVKKCTYSLESEYFSYRRATHLHEPDYGRQLSVITNSVG